MFHLLDERLVLTIMDCKIASIISFECELSDPACHHALGSVLHLRLTSRSLWERHATVTFHTECMNPVTRPTKLTAWKGTAPPRLHFLPNWFEAPKFHKYLVLVHWRWPVMRIHEMLFISFTETKTGSNRLPPKIQQGQCLWHASQLDCSWTRLEFGLVWIRLDSCSAVETWPLLTLSLSLKM